MQIIVPMSGIGARFIAAGYADPKPLIKIDGIPIIYYVIDLFSGNNTFHFICNDQHLENTDMRKILLEKIPSAKIYSVSVNDRKGPVDAVLKICDNINNNEEVIVSYCDYGTEWNYTQFLKDIRENNADGAIAAYIGFHPHNLGKDNYAFMKHEDLWVTDIQEKKSFTGNKMNEYASNGTYYFRNGELMKYYFNLLVHKNITINGEYYVSLVYKLMCEDKCRIRIFEINKMLQWGTPKDLKEYQEWLEYFTKRRKTPMVFKSTMNNITTIIPMAGAGARFKMVGYNMPKPLLPIHGNPMFIEAVCCLPPSKDTVFVCQKSHVDEYSIGTIVSKYCDGKIITIDTVTNGQACTCEIAIKTLNIPVENPRLISACDNGVYYNVDKYNSLVMNKDIDIIVWASVNHPSGKMYPEMYGWLDIDENGFIHNVGVKKPFTYRENTHAIIGTFFFRSCRIFNEGLSEIYNNNIKTNNEFYIDDMLLPLIQKGYNVKVFEVEHYLCWGTPNDYKTYNYWEEHFKK